MQDHIELIDRAEIKDGQAVVAYTRTQAAVAELRKKYEGATYDLTTTAGDRAARAARLELVTVRTSLDRKRKELNAPALEFKKKVDGEAARLTAELVALEQPIDAQIKADEKRRDDERRAREEAEAARKKAHTDGIAKIAGYVAQAAELGSERIASGIAYLEGLDLSGFEEYTTEATETRDRTLAALRTLQAKAKAREDEEVRLQAERAEQARVAAEQAEIARQLKAQQDELERQRAELRAEQEAAQRQQQEREAAERRRREADEAAARQVREQVEAAERRAQQATITHPNGAPMFGESIKDNGDHVMLNAQGKRSVFCDIDEGESPAANVHPLPTRAPAAPSATPTLMLREINARIAPLSITAEGLRTLGFEPAGRDRAAVLYHEGDYPYIVTAAIAHLTKARDGQKAAA